MNRPDGRASGAPTSCTKPLCSQAGRERFDRRWNGERTDRPESSLQMHFPKRSQTALGGFHRRKRAAFLLDQIILDSAALLGGLKDLLPRRRAFAEQRLVALGRIGRPILAVYRVDAARVCLYPSHRVRSRINAKTVVEFMHDVLAGVRSHHFPV